MKKDLNNFLTFCNVVFHAAACIVFVWSDNIFGIIIYGILSMLNILSLKPKE